ncbi:MAG: hypothetical protein ACI4TF_14175 [Oliverpabstia sp.]
MSDMKYLHPELDGVIKRHKEFFQGTRNYLVKVSIKGFDVSSWPMNNDPNIKISERLLNTYEKMISQFVEEVPYDGMDWDREFQSYYKNGVTNRKIRSTYRLDMNVGDDTIPAYFPYFGNAIHHVFFGGEMRFKSGTSYSIPVIEKAEEYGKLAFDTNNIWMQRMCEGMDWCRLHGDGVLIASLRGADGPLDMANGIMGNSIFSEVFEDEDNMAKVMEICTKACDAMCTMQKEHASNIDGGYVTAMGNLWMPDPMFGQISVDAAMMSGPEIYEEFEKPYLEQLAEKYQGFLLHTHMLGWRMHRILAETKGVHIIRPSEDPKQPLVKDAITSLLEQSGDKAFMVEVKKKDIGEMVPHFIGRKVIFELEADDQEDAWSQMEQIHTILDV